MQPSDSSSYDFGFLSVLRDLSPLSVGFEVMNVSRDLFKGSNIEAYIVVSCETVVRSGTDLTLWLSVATVQDLKLPHHMVGFGI